MLVKTYRLYFVFELEQLLLLVITHTLVVVYIDL